MALSVPFRFAVVLSREDGTYLGTAQTALDFESAHEWTRLYLQRKGQLGLNANGDASTVLPNFDPTVGEPYCRGFRIEFALRGDNPVGIDFPNTHFRSHAAAAASLLVEKKKLRVGETYTYLVVAYPAQVEAQNSSGLSVTDSSPALPAHDASLNDFLARSTPRRSHRR